MNWKAVIAHAPGEEALAELLAIPLQQAGYEVAHRGTVLVGQSFPEEISRALNAGGPVVLCATMKAIGSRWAHRLVNAAQAKGERQRIFPVRMEEDADVELITPDLAVAEYWKDSTRGIADLLNALHACYPIEQEGTLPGKTQLLSTAFLDQSAGSLVFDPDALKDFRIELREDKQSDLPAALDSLIFLRRSGLVRNGNLTLTGILLFGETPTNSIPSAMARFVEYEGVSKGSELKIEKEFRVTIIDQITGLQQLISSRIDSKKILRQGSPRRETIYQYPMRTVREIIANALVHRDYEDFERIVHVRLFPDRIEVLSPGTWVGKSLPADGPSISLEELVSESIKRNITLATLISWTGLVEGEGSGIVTAIEECRDASAPIPTVENADGFVKVTIFPRADWKAEEAAKTIASPREITLTTLGALHQIPSPPADFTGREEELEALRTALGQGGTGAIFGLRGMGGIGKTALALKLAGELESFYPDGQFYLDLRGVNLQPLTSEQAMAHVIRSYHPDARLPESEAELVSLYRTVLHGKRVLLLMDNAANREQVEPLIPPSGSLLLMTSRFHFALPGLVSRDLDELPLEDARDLLLKITPRIGNEVDVLALLCGRLPLALRLAGSALAERPDLSPTDYARRLRDGKERFGPVEASLTISYELLSGKQQRLWRLLAVFPGTFDAQAAAAVWELEMDPTSEVLGELVRSSIVEWEEKDGRYRLHELARAFADRQLEDTERDAAKRLLSEYFLKLLRAANELYLQGGAFLDYALRLFDTEWNSFQAGFAWASSHFLEEETAARICDDYPNAGGLLLDLRQHPREQIRWREFALAAARRRKNRRNEGLHLGSLGLAYAALGEPRRAIEYYEHQLAISRDIGDRREEGAALSNLGLAHSALSEPQRAIENNEQALAIAREIGDRRGEGNALGNLGLAYAALGEPRRAIELYEQHLAIARDIGDRQGEGATLGNLGLAYADLGEPRHAIECYEQDLAIARDIGDRLGEGAVLGNLGNAYADLGEPQRAIEFYEQALTIDRDIGYRQGEGTTLGNLGNTYADLGEPQRAIEFYEQALAIANDIGDRRGKGTVLGNVGLAYAALGELRRAIEFYEQALAIARDIGDRQGKARASWNLGLAVEQKGDLARAIDLMQVLVDYQREIDHADAEKHAARVAALRARIAEQSS